jgi:hypothetical protein
LVIGGAVDFVIEPTNSVRCLVGLGEFFAGIFGLVATIDLGVRHAPNAGRSMLSLRH